MEFSFNCQFTPDPAPEPEKGAYGTMGERYLALIRKIEPLLQLEHPTSEQSQEILLAMSELSMRFLQSLGSTLAKHGHDCDSCGQADDDCIMREVVRFSQVFKRCLENFNRRKQEAEGGDTSFSA